MANTMKETSAAVVELYNFVRDIIRCTDSDAIIVDTPEKQMIANF